MKFKNEHITTAFDLISTLSVSGDLVDLICAVRQQLVLADAEFETEQGEEEQGDG